MQDWGRLEQFLRIILCIILCNVSASNFAWKSFSLIWLKPLITFWNASSLNLMRKVINKYQVKLKSNVPISCSLGSEIISNDWLLTGSGNGWDTTTCPLVSSWWLWWKLGVASIWLPPITELLPIPFSNGGSSLQVVYSEHVCPSK